MQLNRILVVLGAREEDWHTDSALIRRAVELGQRFDARLILSHICYDSSIGFGVLASRDEIDNGRLALMARTRERQEALGMQISATSGLSVATETLWDHDRSRSILRSARSWEVDLILKHNGEHRYLLGLLPTTDWDLLRGAKQPVWFVSDAAAESGPENGIIAAVDRLFTDDVTDEEFVLDDESFEAAKMLSDRFQSPLYAAHAYRLPGQLAGYQAHLPAGSAGATPELVAARSSMDADQYEARALQRHRGIVADFLDEHGIPVDDVIVAEGAVDSVLSAAAEEHGAGLIVMGSSSKTWWDRLLGRVSAEPTLSAADVDVLFVKAA